MTCIACHAAVMQLSCGWRWDDVRSFFTMCKGARMKRWSKLRTRLETSAASWTWPWIGPRPRWSWPRPRPRGSRPRWARSRPRRVVASLTSPVETYMQTMNWNLPYNWTILWYCGIRTTMFPDSYKLNGKHNMFHNRIDLIKNIIYFNFEIDSMLDWWFDF